VQSGPKRPNRARPPRRPDSFKGRPQQRRAPNAARPEQRHSQSAQRNYQHYMELARAEAAAGNPVGAENYYQHAEHYFRTMNPEHDTT
jgi:Domain of unknown function (DUF4167)